MSELISIVLTTFNNPSGLYRALKSVLKQTYENIEVLVVDGGKSKYSKYVVDLFNDKRIIHILVKGESDNRICGNVQFCRNLGIDSSQGKFIAMLDDDDIWIKDKLQKQYNLMNITYSSLVCCQTLKLSGDSRMLDKPPNNPRFKDLLKSFCFSQTSCYFMIRKDLLKCGGFNENLRSMHEYDISLRMGKQGMRITVVDKPLVISYCDNVTSRSYYFTKIAELLDLYRVYGKDMCNVLNSKELFLNMIKTGILLSLYVSGYVVKDKIWRVIFKLKEKYQNAKM